MKETDCNKSQILNPKTKRCINKDTKKAIEILFNQKNKNILKLYELINGIIVKKCDKDKVRNEKTNRCIKKKSIDEKVKKSNLLEKKTKKVNELDKKTKKSNSLDKKIDAIKKVKKALIVFKNRVSADIYHRNKYLVLMKRELHKYNKDNKGCLRVYKENPNGSKTYRIGNRIILKERIGSDSVYGIVYLSEFREKTKKLFTFASKVYTFTKKTTMELDLLNLLTNLVRMDMCPHFPIFYGYVICEKMNKIDKDSFIKSNDADKSVSQDIKKFPELIRLNLNSRIITSFNELANGDLWKFLRLYKSNKIYLIHSLIQQLLSIMFFNYHTGRVHNDAHPGNFLFHKIKAGGYFHYKIDGVDYYLENIGFLWVIWDFDFSTTIEQSVLNYNKTKTINRNDYSLLLNAYSPRKLTGYYPYSDLDNEQEYIDIIKLVRDWYYNYFYKEKKPYNIENYRELILKLPPILNSIVINGNKMFLTELPKTAKIINKNPYVIEKRLLFN